MKRLLAVVVAGLMSLSLAEEASAIPVTVAFDGVFSQQGPYDLRGIAFSGEFTFESTTPANLGVYNWGGVPLERTIYADALLAFEVTIQGITFTNSGTLSNGIIVDNNSPGSGLLTGGTDNFFVVMTSAEGSYGQWSQLYLDLRSTNVDLFSSGELPSLLPEISDFDNSHFFRIMRGAGNYSQGDILNLSTPVPEPSTLLLLGSGLLALVGLKRRRKA